MPRTVDKAKRDRAIMDATLQLMARGGFAAVTLRGIAQILKGSITLVTHYYPTRDELLRAFVADLSGGFMRELEQREVGATAGERLAILLEWLVPMSEESLQIEQARVLMSGSRQTDPYAKEFLDTNERNMMGLIREHLAPIVPGESVEGVARLLRAFTNGIVLSTVEHPEYWTPEVRRAALKDLLQRLELI